MPERLQIGGTDTTGIGQTYIEGQREATNEWATMADANLKLRQQNLQAGQWGQENALRSQENALRGQQIAQTGALERTRLSQDYQKFGAQNQLDWSRLNQSGQQFQENQARERQQFGVTSAETARHNKTDEQLAQDRQTQEAYNAAQQQIDREEMPNIQDAMHARQSLESAYTAAGASPDQYQQSQDWQQANQRLQDAQTRYQQRSADALLTHHYGPDVARAHGLPGIAGGTGQQPLTPPAGAGRPSPSGGEWNGGAQPPLNAPELGSAGPAMAGPDSTGGQATQQSQGNLAGQAAPSQNAASGAGASSPAIPSGQGNPAAGGTIGGYKEQTRIRQEQRAQQMEQDKETRANAIKMNQSNAQEIGAFIEPKGGKASQAPLYMAPDEIETLKGIQSKFQQAGSDNAQLTPQEQQVYAKMRNASPVSVYENTFKDIVNSGQGSAQDKLDKLDLVYAMTFDPLAQHLDNPHVLAMMKDMQDKGASVSKRVSDRTSTLDSKYSQANAGLNLGSAVSNLVAGGLTGGPAGVAAALPSLLPSVGGMEGSADSTGKGHTEGTTSRVNAEQELEKSFQQYRNAIAKDMGAGGMAALRARLDGMKKDLTAQASMEPGGQNFVGPMPGSGNGQPPLTPPAGAGRPSPSGGEGGGGGQQYGPGGGPIVPNRPRHSWTLQQEQDAQNAVRQANVQNEQVQGQAEGRVAFPIQGGVATEHATGASLLHPINTLQNLASTVGQMPFLAQAGGGQDGGRGHGLKQMDADARGDTATGGAREFMNAVYTWDNLEAGVKEQALNVAATVAPELAGAAAGKLMQNPAVQKALSKIGTGLKIGDQAAVQAASADLRASFEHPGTSPAEDVIAQHGATEPTSSLPTPGAQLSDAERYQQWLKGLSPEKKAAMVQAGVSPKDLEAGIGQETPPRLFEAGDVPGAKAGESAAIRQGVPVPPAEAARELESANMQQAGEAARVPANHPEVQKIIDQLNAGKPQSAMNIPEPSLTPGRAASNESASMQRLQASDPELYDRVMSNEKRIGRGAAEWQQRAGAETVDLSPAGRPTPRNFRPPEDFALQPGAGDDPLAMQPGRDPNAAPPAAASARLPQQGVPLEVQQYLDSEPNYQLSQDELELQPGRDPNAVPSNPGQIATGARPPSGISGRQPGPQFPGLNPTQAPATTPGFEPPSWRGNPAVNPVDAGPLEQQAVQRANQAVQAVQDAGHAPEEVRAVAAAHGDSIAAARAQDAAMTPVAAAHADPIAAARAQDQAMQPGNAARAEPRAPQDHNPAQGTGPTSAKKGAPWWTSQQPKGQSMQRQPLSNNLDVGDTPSGRHDAIIPPGMGPQTALTPKITQWLQSQPPEVQQQFHAYLNGQGPMPLAIQIANMKARV